MENRDVGGLSWGEGFVELRQQGVVGRGWWVALGGGVGVNIVMISPEFPSTGPMRRERDGEREKGGERKREQLLSCHRQQP